MLLWYANISNFNYLICSYLKKKRQIAPLHNKFWYNCTNYVKHTIKEPNFINPILSGLFHIKTYHWVLNFVDSKSKVIKIFIRMERKAKKYHTVRTVPKYNLTAM